MVKVFILLILSSKSISLSSNGITLIPVSFTLLEYVGGDETSRGDVLLSVVEQFIPIELFLVIFLFESIHIVGDAFCRRCKAWGCTVFYCSPWQCFVGEFDMLTFFTRKCA